MGAADELRQLASDLSKGVDPDAVRGAVRAGAEDVKARMRSDASGTRHFRKLARTITYDQREFWGGPGAEIGPERRGQGRLAGIAYFGGRNGGGGMIPDPSGALDAAGPALIRALGDLAEEIL